MPWRTVSVSLVSILVLMGGRAPRAQDPARHLVIVVDGLRPDYVTPDVMPNLTALGARGVVFSRHHSVFPTVTRVNASSISTGAYPETHGLLGNTVFFPKVNPARFLDTSDRSNLLSIATAEGRLLTAPTLGESLRAAGRRMLVVSSGSSGSAYLNNHTVAGGGIIHLEYTLPETLAEAVKAIGPAPGANAAPGAPDSYAVDAFLKIGLARVDPSVTVMWLSDLDSTAHDKGIGAPETVAILRHVDGEIKRIQDGLAAAGLLDRYDIWVTSDHGFSTYTGAADLGPILAPFARTLADGSPRIVAGGGAIYVRDQDPQAVSSITATLQRTPKVGAIFTRAAAPGSLDGVVPGTLSFDAIRWTHERSAQVLFSPDWTDDENAYHMRGTSTSNGVAGHGSSSPREIHNTLIAAGPGIRRGVVIDTPSGNVDFAPTFLTRLGLPIPASMTGRPLREAFAAVPLRVDTTEHRVTNADGSYAVTATFSTVRADDRTFRYFDSTRVVRR